MRCVMRCVSKFECFSFDVACVQCGHPHLYQQVPFAWVALLVASRVLCGLGLKNSTVRSISKVGNCTRISRKRQIQIKPDKSRCVLSKRVRAAHWGLHVKNPSRGQKAVLSLKRSPPCVAGYDMRIAAGPDVSSKQGIIACDWFT